MTREEAIEIIRKEYKCLKRDCDIERSCGKCEFYIPSTESILRAYEMAIQALNSLEEVYANGYNDGFMQAEVNYENDKALSQEPPTFNWVQNRVDLAKAEINNAIESTFCTKDEAIGLGIALNVLDKYFTI